MITDTHISNLFDELSQLSGHLTLNRQQLVKDLQLKELELSKQQLHAIYLIAKRESMTVGEFALELGITSGAATQMLDLMENRQIIERQADPNDRRVSRIILGEVGISLARKLKAIQKRHLHEVFQHATEDEIETMTRIVKRLNTVHKEGQQ